MTRPNKISTIGLKAHLNGTKVAHNNKGFKDFLDFYQNRTSIVDMAKEFGVHRLTMMKWVDLHEFEKGRTNNGG